MRWKIVLVAGLLVSAALLVAAKATLPPHSDSVIPALPLYLAWAAAGAVAITLALTWLLVVDTPFEVARAVVILASAVTLVGVGEGAIYVDRHPSYGMCTRLATGRVQCAQQPNRPEAASHATQIFLGGSAVVAAMGAAAFAAIRRARPPRAA
ncbi:MAG TPA: hypothetical protein VGL44_10450 [Gaiellales bacterium]